MSNKTRKTLLGLRALYNLNVKRDPGAFAPPIMVIMLSDRCNYRCVTCGCYEIGDKDRELPTEKWLDVLRDFRDLGGLSVRFTGGEVFLRKKTLYPLMEFLGRNGITSKISTNGSLIRDKDIEFLKTHDVGVVEISLHGREKTHEDYVKIKGSHGRTLDVIDRLKAAGVPVRLAFTMIKSNLADLEYIVEYAHGKGVLASFNVMENNAYYFQGIDASEIPSQEEMERASETLLELKRRYPSSVNGTEKQLKAIPALYADNRMPEYYCARVLMHVYLDSFGNVYHGCWAMPAAGNVNDRSLREIVGSPEYAEGRRRGFNKECPGCTCGWQMDISMGFVKRPAGEREKTTVENTPG